MRLELRWATGEYVERAIGEDLDTPAATGMDVAELAAAAESFPGNAVISTEVSSQGRGASGPAIAVIVELERYAADTGALIAIGTGLVGLIRSVRRRFHRDPVVEDPSTIGALAAIAASSDLTGLSYVGTVPITANPGVGTDRRDIWASCFRGSEEAGTATIVFMSPSGTCLGSVKVPTEMYLTKDGWTMRTADELKHWWGG